MLPVPRAVFQEKGHKVSCWKEFCSDHFLYRRRSFNLTHLPSSNHVSARSWIALLCFKSMSAYFMPSTNLLRWLPTSRSCECYWKSLQHLSTVVITLVHYPVTYVHLIMRPMQMHLLGHRKCKSPLPNKTAPVRDSTAILGHSKNYLFNSVPSFLWEYCTFIVSFNQNFMRQKILGDLEI